MDRIVLLRGDGSIVGDVFSVVSVNVACQNVSGVVADGDGIAAMVLYWSGDVLLCKSVDQADFPRGFVASAHLPSWESFMGYFHSMGGGD